MCEITIKEDSGYFFAVSDDPETPVFIALSDIGNVYKEIESYLSGLFEEQFKTSGVYNFSILENSLITATVTSSS